MRRVLLFLLLGACALASSPAHAPILSTDELDLRLLEEGTRTYTVFYDGDPVGEYSYALRRETSDGRAVFRVSRAYETPDGPVQQMALFDARTFEPIRSESRGAVSVRLEYADGRVRGTVGIAGAPEESMDALLPSGALFPYMFEAAVSVMPLLPGYVTQVPVVNPASALVETVGVRVLDQTTITVPAGSFAVYEVEITGFEPETLYVRRDKPHIPIRQDLPAPVSIQLTSVSQTM